MTDTAKWYVVHTYSGHENKVKINLEKIVENREMEEVIQEISVPTEEVTEIKNGKKKVKQRKIFPGYVLIKMIITNESWYVVRNTRGVTGFVGPGSKPVPLTDDEVKRMGIDTRVQIMDMVVGDSVRVISGPFENFIGVVEEANHEKHSIKVMISMFGRETSVELEYIQVEKL